jgi:hypothetical protein
MGSAAAVLRSDRQDSREPMPQANKSFPPGMSLRRRIALDPLDCSPKNVQ